MISYVISLTLLTLAVMVIRGTFRNKMSSRLVYALWLAVLVRMVLPFDMIQIDHVGLDYIGALESAAGHEIVVAEGKSSTEAGKVPETAKPVSDILLSESNVKAETVPFAEKLPITGDVTESYVWDEPTYDNGIGAVGGPETNSEIQNGKPATEFCETAAEMNDGQTSVSYDGSADRVSVSVKDILNGVWLVGAVLTMLAFTLSWVTFSARLRKTRSPLTTDGRIKVYVSGLVSSPCVCGIIPRIYVTPEARDSESLSTVILHERVHIYHGDNIWSILRVAAVSVFWWNPVIWAAAILSKWDAEFACDESVALKLKDITRIEYAKMIVDMTPAAKNYAVSFAGGPIKERVVKLTSKHKNKLIVAAGAVLLLAVCIIMAFVGMKYSEAEKTNEKPQTGESGKVETETLLEHDPDVVYGSFAVYENTEENLEKFAPTNTYDVSTSEYSFSLILVATEDVSDFKINRLFWNDDLLLDTETELEDVGEVGAGEAMLITTDSVEIIGYVGVSYTVDGETERYYPATSGMDGSAILVEIGNELLSSNIVPEQQEGNLILEKFNVYSVEDYGEDRLEGLPIYDKSSSENSFRLVLEAKEDDLSAWLTYLNWHDNKYVESELETTKIHNLMKGEACVICVDIYEPVSRVGLQFQHDRKFYRACPVLDEDGKPILESIDDRLGPTFHLYGKIYPVTVGGADSLQSQLDKYFETDDFVNSNSKMLEVRGLSKEFYFWISYDDLRGAWLDMESFELVSECDKADLDNRKTEIYEWNGFIVLSRESYEIGDTWFFRDGDVTEFHPDGESSVTFSLDENGDLKYTRFSERFNGNVHENPYAVLETAYRRDEFLSETGSVDVDADGRIVLIPENTYTVSDVYGLDDIFEEYSKTDEFKRKYPACTTADEVLYANEEIEVLRRAGESNVCYKWVAAFLGRDAETLVSMTSYDMYTGDPILTKERMTEYLQTVLDGIVIGDFTVVRGSDDGDRPMQFDFEIISSTVDTFPAGYYSVDLSYNGNFTSPGVYFTCRPGVVTIADENESFFAERMFDSWYGGLDYPQAVGSYASLALFYLYENANGLEYKGNTALTKAELEAIASEIYEEGFEIDYHRFDYHEGENGEEGYYTVRGMGGTVKYHDIMSRVENDGVITYDVVYYAEPMKLIPAKIFRYTVERTDSVYGFRLAGVEEIDSTGLEIFTQGM